MPRGGARIGASRPKGALGYSRRAIHDAVKVPASEELSFDLREGASFEFWVKPEEGGKNQPLITWTRSTASKNLFGVHLLLETTSASGLAVMRVLLFFDRRPGPRAFEPPPRMMTRASTAEIITWRDQSARTRSVLSVPGLTQSLTLTTV
jgi:hypothetical protein